ncbi:MAG: hypothetical protein WBW74_27940 [Xanthobacteraceae bacterium]
MMKGGADVGIAGEQRAHGIGIAGDMDVLDLETVQPALLLRHQIGQREGRDRTGEDHLDLGGEGGGRIGDEQDGEAAKAQQECARSNRMAKHDNSSTGRKSGSSPAIRKMSRSGNSCKRFLPCRCTIPVAG